MKAYRFRLRPSAIGDWCKVYAPTWRLAMRDYPNIPVDCWQGLENGVWVWLK